MTTPKTGRLVRTAAAFAVTAAAAGCGGSAHGSPAAKPLHGLLTVAPGHCTTATAAPTGSYLVVIDEADNRIVRNPDSSCADKLFTLLSPGTDGGVELGRFQPDPDPLWNARRNSLASAIIKPVNFQGFDVGFATDTQDVQDAPAGGPVFPAPTAVVTGGNRMEVDLRSLNLTYAGNPGGDCLSQAGLGCWNLGSMSAAGSYDPATRTYTLQWFVGETFTAAGDSLEVHLQGVLRPSAPA